MTKNRPHRLTPLPILLVFVSLVAHGRADQLPDPIEPGTLPCVSAQLIYELEGRPTPECHASTIVETPVGLVAAWFGGSYEKHPDVGIWVARHDRRSWSAPVQIADGSEGETEDYSCWNPVLFQPASGPLLLFYKVGLSPREWWGMLTTSADHGKTWTPPRRLGTSAALQGANRNLLGPVKNKPVQLDNGTLLCPSSTEHDGWRVHLEQTRDLGKNWRVIGPLADPQGFEAIQPTILQYADGRLQLLCRTKRNVIAQSWSDDQGATWSRLAETSLPHPNSGIDAVSLQDGRQLLVYNHSLRSGEHNGRQILNVALSEDGKTWKPALTLENEGNKDGYSYPAVIQSSDGRVHITYTWRRLSVKHVVLDPAAIVNP